LQTVNDPIEFLMIGGFLGAGKTKLIANLAKRLQAEGKHVCFVTNDQAAGLVDTGLLKSFWDWMSTKWLARASAAILTG